MREMTNSCLGCLQNVDKIMYTIYCIMFFFLLTFALYFGFVKVGSGGVGNIICK